MTDGGEMPLCDAKTHKGTTCKRPAGWGTNHAGKGRCKLHGGSSNGPPKGNRNAVKWGFWSKHVSSEQLQIMQDIDQSEPADILWSNILLSYSAIIRAQRIMFVVDENDHSDFTVKEGLTQSGEIIEKERKWSFDKHANFMQAQSRAQSELRSLIKDFLTISDEKDIRRLKLENIQKDIELKQAQIAKLNGDSPDEFEDDGFMDALKGQGKKVWDDDDDEES